MLSQPTRPAAALFLLGFLTLFVELVLIRYLAGNIWNLSYFPNLVLLAVFLGMGLGFIGHHYLSPRVSETLFGAAPFLLLGLVTVVMLFRPVVPGFSSWGGDIGGEVYFTANPTDHTEASSLLFLVWFVAILAVFAALCQRTAKLFAGFAPLHAYTLDIGGSCAGIVAFIGLSFLRLPAWTWFMVAGIAVVACAGFLGWSRARFALILPFIAIAAIAIHQDSALLSAPELGRPTEVTWSPYQKVEYVNAQRTIFVNGVSHQTIQPLSTLRTMFYQVPHDRRRERGLPPYKRVLVIGAGSGNDVAVALANGAEHVDAVEIDPVIAGIGKRYHPAAPYSDPRVTLHINDARAVMTRSDGHYDLVIFALTDSLVKVSSMAQLRLENYLFTQDSFSQAARLLNPQGDLIIYNFYRRDWLIGKFVKMLRTATGHTPEKLFEHQDFAMFRAGRAASQWDNLGSTPVVAVADADVPTDDWPFPYLRVRHVPALYTTVLLAVAGLLVLLFTGFQLAERRRAQVVAGRRSIALNLAFLGMGVAFLLLETKSIVQFSLLFGTTWLNTSLVFLAILASVLAANWTAVAVKSRAVLPVVFVLLLGSALLPLVYPLRNLLALDSDALRFVCAAAMTFSPIYFANLIFSVSFREQAAPEHVFGWNLLGATAGGLLEYTSMAIGYNALAVAVAICYAVVFALLMWARRAPAHAATADDVPNLAA